MAKRRLRWAGTEKVVLDNRHRLSYEERQARPLEVLEGKFNEWLVLQIDYSGLCPIKACEGDMRVLSRRSRMWQASSRMLAGLWFLTSRMK